MGPDRIVQLVFGLIMTASVASAGFILPHLHKVAETQRLRYTDDVIEGAPPIVALGTAIGALRGVIADYLWIRVMVMKERGQYYEVMANADLITKLQPRFAEVWAFHGHNMAYNISVVTNTPQERWTWVKSGIDLVRKEGLKWNPNNLILHKELAFWFAHKIEGNSDDAHLFYKREFGREWHFLLGEPPYDHAERTAWIKKVADAPETLEEAEARTPGVMALVDRLREEMSPYEKRFKFALNGKLLRAYGAAESVASSSWAQIMGMHESFQANDPLYNLFYSIIHDEQLKDVRETLLAHLRKSVLKAEYNMDPQLMYEYTRDYGPLDWRHGQSHALYWSTKGTQFAEARYQNVEDDYKIINTDRYRIQAMQALTFDGLVRVDPFSNEVSPSRLPDLRWVDAYFKTYRTLHKKFYDYRGAASDSFVAGYENFMSHAVRMLYRAGEFDAARARLKDLDDLFGRGGQIPNTKYAADLDVFVREVTLGEYENTPYSATTDVRQALRRGFMEGILLNKPALLRDAITFAGQVRDYFRGSRYASFVTKFGTGRMADLLGSLRSAVEDTFATLMVDTSVPLLDRLEIYRKATDEYKRMAYDSARPQIEREMIRLGLNLKLPIERAFPEPPGMEEYRANLAAKRERERSDDERLRGEFDRK